MSEMKFKARGVFSLNMSSYFHVNICIKTNCNIVIIKYYAHTHKNSSQAKTSNFIEIKTKNLKKIMNLPKGD